MGNSSLTFDSTIPPVEVSHLAPSMKSPQMLAPSRGGPLKTFIFIYNLANKQKSSFIFSFFNDFFASLLNCSFYYIISRAGTKL